MTKQEQELFEKYLMDDEWYAKHFCFNEAECYEIEKGLSYDDDLWLFNSKPNYGLEDEYDEESMP